MPSKRDQLSKVTQFGGNVSKPTIQSITAAGYGDALSQIVDNRLIAEPVPIAEIHPDSAQPRRIMPSAVRSAWNGQTDSESMGALFSFWWSLVQSERGSEFDLHAHLEQISSVTDERDGAEDRDEETLQKQVAVPQRCGPIEKAWLSLIAHASTIRRETITNPITAVQCGPGEYIIETGERRFMAFQMLAWAYPAEAARWQKIPVRRVENASVWRQATENGSRQNLSSIGKARQYALLLMEAVKEAEPTKRFRTFVECEDEYTFYRQAHDQRIPHLFRDRIAKAMGVTSPGELARYRSILGLDPLIWEFADDYDVALSNLLPLIQLSPEEALRRLQKQFAEKTAGLVKPPPQLSDRTRTSFNRLWKAASAGKPLNRSDLVLLKEWIAQVEAEGQWKE